MNWGPSYSALKSNAPSSHEKMWQNLQCISPSERSQSKRFIMYDSNSDILENQWLPGVEGKEG
jgi:hypothetical protein